MLFALPGTGPDIPAAWAWLDEFIELSPPQSRAQHEHQGLQYVAMALARAGLPDSARAVARRGRADADVDPVRDLALLESISRSWLGDFDEAVDLSQRHRRQFALLQQGECRRVQVRCAVDQRAVEVENDRTDHRGTP